uniref:Uncharacterized protein n=1 Tax=Cucumis melo TaxID=3656 RepID=A0A9I9EBG0_CUCME
MGSLLVLFLDRLGLKNQLNALFRIVELEIRRTFIDCLDTAKFGLCDFEKSCWDYTTITCSFFR